MIITDDFIAPINQDSSQASITNKVIKPNFIFLVDHNIRFPSDNYFEEIQIGNELDCYSSAMLKDYENDYKIIAINEALQYKYFKECQELYPKIMIRNNSNFLKFHGLGIGSGFTFSVFYEKPKTDFFNFIKKPNLNFEKKISIFSNLLDIIEYLIEIKELQFFQPEFLFIDKNENVKLLYLGNYLCDQVMTDNKETLKFNESVKVFSKYRLSIEKYSQEFFSFHDYLSSINPNLNLECI